MVGGLCQGPSRRSPEARSMRPCFVRCEIAVARRQTSYLVLYVSEQTTRARQHT